MLKVRIKGESQPRLIPAGHDTVRSADGASLQVIDKDGSAIQGATFKAADVVVVVRVDNPAPAPAPKAPAAAAPPAPAKA